VSICEGDIKLTNHFISSIYEEITRKDKNNEQVHYAITNLWQSIKTKVFINYSPKHLQSISSWITTELIKIAQNNETKLTETQTSQLLILFELISLLTTSKHPKTPSESQRNPKPDSADLSSTTSNTSSASLIKTTAYK
jgi:hypothetical protein